MTELKMQIQQWLIELLKHKDETRKNRQIYIRYLDGKIETLENVLEMIKEIESKGGDTE